MKEFIRTLYNHSLYGFLKFASIPIRSIQFFPDANGWSLTYRHKEWVYKRFSLPFLFHPENTFARFVALHRELASRGMTEYIPQHEEQEAWVRYAFIPDAHNLLDALLRADQEYRVRLLADVFQLMDYFHERGLIHGDLKPKNILVTPAGKLYAIDLENARLSDTPADRLIDYGKLLPRIIYLFTSQEIRSAADAADVSAPLRSYLEERVLASFGARDLIKGIPGLTFEAESSVPGDDIDVHVPDVRGLQMVCDRASEHGLDTRLFFHARDDVKVFIYTASMIETVDVHLVRPLSRSRFLREKQQNPPAQIALMGPDGSGKTTLIDALLRSQDPHFAAFRMKAIHAWRFAKEQDPETCLEQQLNRLCGGLFTRLPAYGRLIRTGTHPVILLDRSFFDPFFGSSILYRFLWLFRNFMPDNMHMLLLRIEPETARSRKPELTEEEIRGYYARAAASVPRAIPVPVTSVLETEQTVCSLVRYLILTDRSFTR